MSIRTIDELSDRLANELAWRKKELSDIKYYLDLSSSDIGRRRVLSRSGVTMLYAHWEGFIKLAGRYFLEYVTMQRITNKELHPNLLTVSMRNNVSFSSNTRKTSEYGKLSQFYLTKMSDKASIPYKTAIDTESNLSSTVLREIVWCLGIDYSVYEMKEKFIDSQLLARRNNIAHGEAIDVNPAEYDKMRSIVVEMMTQFKTQLENSAVMKQYRLS